MAATPNLTQVFISYACRDRDRVLPIADRLAAAGVPVWLDRYRIEGGTRWAAEIVSALEASRVVMLVCSDASMRSWAVKQEIQLAGENQKILLPLILEKTNFPVQMKFFLAGWQWIEILDRPVEQWLPPGLRALQIAGVALGGTPIKVPEVDEPLDRNQLEWSFEGLQAIARFSDQIWPIAARTVLRCPSSTFTRGLGAPQEAAQHRFHVGDKIRLVIESDHRSHLLLLDEGPERRTYCLCPSHFARDTLLLPGFNILPQVHSPYDSFVITGKPGRENLLAILSDEPLGMNWSPNDPQVPARVLANSDLQQLMEHLRLLGAHRWIALSTCFDVLEPSC